MGSVEKQTTGVRRPPWLKVRLPHGHSSAEVRHLLSDLHLNTVCQSARCPNLAECWGARTTTFLILGNVCTRRCSFCAVSKGTPKSPDPQEPVRVAEAAFRLNLKLAVVTSVTRDDLSDGGASYFVQTIQTLRQRLPNIAIEVLVPDFKGNYDALNTVLSAKPDILNHNLETVPRLYPIVRAGASYQRSLTLLQLSAESGITTKSGLMLGLGETIDEVISVMKDLRKSNCQILTLGQYLQPTKKQLSVSRFVTPEEFSSLKDKALSLGFAHVESGPLVRSSYMAHRALVAD